VCQEQCQRQGGISAKNTVMHCLMVATSISYVGFGTDRRRHCLTQTRARGTD
jgi:hypothetical protein